jgi:hypothetical protein
LDAIYDWIAASLGSDERGVRSAMREWRRAAEKGHVGSTIANLAGASNTSCRYRAARDGGCRALHDVPLRPVYAPFIDCLAQWPGIMHAFRQLRSRKTPRWRWWPGIAEALFARRSAKRYSGSAGLQQNRAISGRFAPAVWTVCG